MTADKTDLLQGTLDLLVLKALAGGPLHGLGVSRRIGLITRGAFDVKPGRSSRRSTGSRRTAGCLGPLGEQSPGPVLH
jgi:hypothetical protein